MNTKPLFIPSSSARRRQGRRQRNVAKFVFGEVKKRAGVETELIDIRNLKFPTHDAGEAIKDPGFSETVARAEWTDSGLFLNINHGYPGLLKHALDTNLKEYIHKAVGVCGVSAGIFGGVRND